MKSLHSLLFSRLLLPLLLAPMGTAAAQDNMAAADLYLRAQAGQVRAVIEIEIDHDWHLYHTEVGGDVDEYGDGYPAKPLVITPAGEGITWSEPRLPEPERHQDEQIDNWANIHHGTIYVYLSGELEEGAQLPEIEIEVDGLTCSEKSGTCIPYNEVLEVEGEGSDALFADFPKDLVPGAASGTGAGGSNATPDVPELNPDVDYAAVTFQEYSTRSEEKSHGLGIWLLLAFIAGMILNVMPCVLPVVSIKVLSFVQQAGESRSRILGLGLSFAAGIMVVFLALAGLGAFAGQGWGEQFQSPTFLIVMIGVVFAFALSMFDVFELGVPRGVSALAGRAPREGMVDAFFKGIMATVLATPCSGPFLGSTLAWALAQPPLTIFLIFTMIGLGMATPYVILTANPGFLKLVPKPGPWMVTFKHCMGFLLLFTIVYLMISLHQDYLLFTVTFLVFVAMGCWIWGRFANFDQKIAARLATLGIVVFVVFGGARIAFVDFRGLFAGVEGGGDHIAWEDFDPVKLEAYHEEGRSVFVDFTADWCPNCKYNERFVFEAKPVRELIEARDVVCMRADLTHDNPRTDMMERLRDKLGSRSIPFLAVFPGNEPHRPFVRHDIVTEAQMIEIFEALPEPEKLGKSSGSSG